MFISLDGVHTNYVEACGHTVNESLKEQMAKDVNSQEATWMSLFGDVRGPSTISWVAYFKQS